ncbi:MAG TPA: YHS domain-containing protein [Candidatus Binataceae bacterium]|nr:YHS domain-containing protein [Candidatus Binataceae bacterium]
MSLFPRCFLILVVLFGLSLWSSSAVHADSNAIAAVLNAPPQKDLGTAATCAVCGMKVHVKKDTPTAEYKGKDYYFCDESERDTFVKDPGKYLSQK